MTVCIAAIAAKSQAIVCIADRALTFAGAIASAQTDSGVTKIVDVSNTNWCAMFSGDDLTFPSNVLRLVSARLSGMSYCDKNTMEGAVKTAFEECWKMDVEECILKPKILSLASLTEPPEKRDARLSDSEYLNKLAEEIANYRHNCAMIFCGFDADGPHIFLASTPSQISPNDWQGFQAIGAGEETARNHLIWSEYDKEDSLDSVIYDVFAAKVATEVLQGIGYAWNWRVLISGQKPQTIPKRINNLIDKAWSMSNRSPYAPPMPRRERAPDNWKKELSDFCVDLLSKSKRPKQ